MTPPLHWFYSKGHVETPIVWSLICAMLAIAIAPFIVLESQTVAIVSAGVVVCWFALAAFVLLRKRKKMKRQSKQAVTRLDARYREVIESVYKEVATIAE